LGFPQGLSFEYIHESPRRQRLGPFRGRAGSFGKRGMETTWIIFATCCNRLVMNPLSGGGGMKEPRTTIENHFSQITEPRESGQRNQLIDIITIDLSATIFWP
jgi:hypothetical protein